MQNNFNNKYITEAKKTEILKKINYRQVSIKAFPSLTP